MPFLCSALRTNFHFKTSELRVCGKLHPATVLLFAGQGAQFSGMGHDLWTAYPAITETAEAILGYSLPGLCLSNTDGRLNRTEYTQPALYTVQVLQYLRWLETVDGPPAAAAGHSLGEYAALHAAGCFDFETGLRLVQRRGDLMSRASGGGMTAVVGIDANTVKRLLAEDAFAGVDLANYNSPEQVVIAGPTEDVKKAGAALATRGARCFPLNVSAAFHSRYMRPAREAFAQFLQGFTFNDPKFPVIANSTARPYGRGRVAQLLAEQFAAPVLWTESVRYLLAQGDYEFLELGADFSRPGGAVLTKLVAAIRKAETETGFIPASAKQQTSSEERAERWQGRSFQSEAVPAADCVSDPDRLSAPVRDARPGPGTSFVLPQPLCSPETLGSAIFRKRYGLRYAYVAGGMYRGVASADMVVRMGRAGMLGFLGAGGMRLEEVASSVDSIRSGLADGQAYGVNLLADHNRPDRERRLVDLCLGKGVKIVEAAAFLQMTPALVLYRLRGLRREPSDEIRCDHRILAKLSRREVAEAFMSPAPQALVRDLLEQGAVTAEQAQLAEHVPMSHDLCVEADSGGHTDSGVATILLPAMLLLRDKMQQRYGYGESICMGMAGGIGTPGAAAAAFTMGADFILTGSINQCTVESGAAESVKDMLQGAGIHDMAYAPAGDMFEMGAKVQVLKKGLLFPMRASRLHALYTHYSGLEDIPVQEREKLERSVFRRTFEDIWQECLLYLEKNGRGEEAESAKTSPKVRMARVFKWYFSYATDLSFREHTDDPVNRQIHTGPALGAFNQWVAGTGLESWRSRHVDAIALHLLEATSKHLSEHLSEHLGRVSGRFAATDPQ